MNHPASFAVVRSLFVSSVALVIAIAGCGGSDSGPVYATGAAQGACYPNGTCNAGLVCSANVCVASADGGVTNDSGASVDAAADAFNDAGLPCPGATINHPSNNETRAANTQVPFIGSARDPQCKPIEGQNLAWDDNGKPIGTGATFNYSFTTTGTRTITLTATNGSAKYTAAITLNIN